MAAPVTSPRRNQRGPSAPMNRRPARRPGRAGSAGPCSSGPNGPSPPRCGRRAWPPRRPISSRTSSHSPLVLGAANACSWSALSWRTTAIHIPACLVEVDLDVEAVPHRHQQAAEVHPLGCRGSRPRHPTGRRAGRSGRPGRGVAQPGPGRRVAQVVMLRPGLAAGAGLGRRLVLGRLVARQDHRPRRGRRHRTRPRRTRSSSSSSSSPSSGSASAELGFAVAWTRPRPRGGVV